MGKIKVILKSNRFKSFYWRLGMMIVATTVAFLSENIADFGLSTQTTVVLGLILGELSKYMNTKKA